VKQQNAAEKNYSKKDYKQYYLLGINNKIGFQQMNCDFEISLAIRN